MLYYCYYLDLTMGDVIEQLFGRWVLFMNKKKDILLDVDEVICFSGFLEAVNDFMGKNYVIDDFKDYYIDEVAVPKEKFDEFNQFVNTRNLYENAHILPKAVETLEELNRGYNIYPCSSCVNPFDVKGSGRNFQDKYNFLINTLPFIKAEHFIFTSTKHLFQADIQIDDRLSNLDNKIETRILFPSYHNRDITNHELKEKRVLRAGFDWRDGWDEVAHILLDEKPKTYSLKK